MMQCNPAHISGDCYFSQNNIRQERGFLKLHFQLKKSIQIHYTSQKMQSTLKLTLFSL